MRDDERTYVGFRAWVVTHLEDRIELHSLWRDFTWNLEGVSRARCDECEIVPNPEHECGFNSWVSLWQLEHYLTRTLHFTEASSRSRVMGIAQIGGLATRDFKEGKLMGLRSSQAMPVAFLNPATPKTHPWLQEVAERFGAPVLSIADEPARQRVSRLASEWGEIIAFPSTK